VPELIGPSADVFQTGTFSRTDILALDRVAACAWPAPESTFLDGWQLRFGDGVSRRANSCAPFPPPPSAAEFKDRLHTVEAFYRGHDLPPRFQISPAATPDNLDGELSQRRYVMEAPVNILVAPSAAVARLGAQDDIVTVDEKASDDWWPFYVNAFDRDASEILAGARDTVGFASVRGTNGIETIGIGVIGGGWLGIFGMFTLHTHRGRGRAKQLMTTLAAWALARGAFGIYLQVEDHNDDARRLYERLGFKRVYGYHYRTLWT
tara:strand:- start:10407 stop:11198 length:792 start_codon:yes stop_codon:yes gene_type:complete